MLAIEALRRYTPGCETARLRNFGMTIGIRDTRKIDASTTSPRPMCAKQGRFGQHRHLPRVHRRIRRAGAADDRALLRDPVRRTAAAAGSSSTKRNVTLLLAALESILRDA
jgi:hypothetical protein